MIETREVPRAMAYNQLLDLMKSSPNDPRIKPELKLLQEGVRNRLLTQAIQHHCGRR